MEKKWDSDQIIYNILLNNALFGSDCVIAKFQLSIQKICNIILIGNEQLNLKETESSGTEKIFLRVTMKVLGDKMFVLFAA